jgi:hypothetical protein
MLKPVHVDAHIWLSVVRRTSACPRHLIAIRRALDIPLTHVAELTSALGASIGEATRVSPGFRWCEDGLEGPGTGFVASEHEGRHRNLTGRSPVR